MPKKRSLPLILEHCLHEDLRKYLSTSSGESLRKLLMRFRYKAGALLPAPKARRYPRERSNGNTLEELGLEMCVYILKSTHGNDKAYFGMTRQRRSRLNAHAKYKYDANAVQAAVAMNADECAEFVLAADPLIMEAIESLDIPGLGVLFLNPQHAMLYISCILVEHLYHAYYDTSTKVTLELLYTPVSPVLKDLFNETAEDSESIDDLAWFKGKTVSFPFISLKR
jgi:hypothetical protein